jgi:hypothetical protein
LHGFCVRQVHGLDTGNDETEISRRIRARSNPHAHEEKGKEKTGVRAQENGKDKTFLHTIENKKMSTATATAPLEQTETTDELEHALACSLRAENAALKEQLRRESTPTPSLPSDYLFIDGQRVYTAQQISRHLGYSVSKVYELMVEGHLPYFYRGFDRRTSRNPRKYVTAAALKTFLQI